MKTNKMIDLSGNNNHAVAGNMYDFAVTWNPLAGKCLHACKYCYVEVQKKRYEAHRIKYSGFPRLDENAMKTNLYSKKYKGKTIFVGSCNDLFAENVSTSAIGEIIEKANLYHENKFFWQTKNPKLLMNFAPYLPKNSIVCTTMENEDNFLSFAPSVVSRALAMGNIVGFEKHITIEPLVKFKLEPFLELIKIANPNQVNIGCDSKNNNLPESSKEKVLQLIAELEKFTVVHKKSNLSRLLK